MKKGLASLQQKKGESRGWPFSFKGENRKRKEIEAREINNFFFLVGETEEREREV